MTSPEQTPTGLTRRQLRELRATDAVPVISAETPVAQTDAPATRSEARAVAQPVTPAPPQAPAEAPRAMSRRELRALLGAESGATGVVAPIEPAVHVEPPFEAGVETPAATLPPASPRWAERPPADSAPASLAVPAAPVATPVPAVPAPIREVAEPETGGTSYAPVPFDDVLSPPDTARSARITPTMLIMSDPSQRRGPDAPLDARGEVLVTGVYQLPSSLGSQGHVAGTTDGLEVDAALFDRELDLASSPTPIAASSAISTSKPAAEVIRQPLPEKRGKLVMGLAITAGGLMIALSAALILAFMNGVF